MSETGKVYQIQYPTTVSGKVYNVRDVSGEQNVTGKVYQVASVNGGGGSKTKFGATIDDFLGNVDANGNYVAPTEPFEINLAGVKSMPDYGFNYKFSNCKEIQKVVANDVVSVGANAFYHAFSMSTSATYDNIPFQFDGLEIIDNQYAFAYACYNRQVAPSFKSLKKIVANYAFNNFSSSDIDYEKTFPVLEEISGDRAMQQIDKTFDNKIYSFLSIKKITGGAYATSSTFGSILAPNTVWNFPSATEFTGYIWNTNSSYASEIHFAAANQAAIEACDGYANKWGFAGATIYFDL